MRPPLLAILIVCLCSFLGMADNSSPSSSLKILTLTSFTTVVPQPITVTSSQNSAPTSTTTGEWYISAGLVIIYTTYPPGGSPIILTTTDLTTWSKPFPSSVITYVLTSTSTSSVPIPQTMSSSSSANQVTGPLTSSSSSMTSKSLSSSTPRVSSSSKSSAAIAPGTSVTTLPDNNTHKSSTPKLIILVPAIAGGIVAIVGICFLIWWLRRRRNSRNKSISDPIELPERYVGNGAPTDLATRGQRKTLKKTFADLFKKGEEWWIDTGPIKKAFKDFGEEIQQTHSRQAAHPEGLYEADTHYIMDPQPVELPGHPVFSNDQGLALQHSRHSRHSSNISVAPSIPPKSPDRDLTIYGENATRRSSCEHPRWSNFDGHFSAQSAELHGATASVTQVPDRVTTPTDKWVEPPSAFSSPSTSSNCASTNMKSTGDRNSTPDLTPPTTWVEPIVNRDRSYNAIPPTPVDAEILRTVAERDNTLAILEGRRKVHKTATFSSVFDQDKERRFYQEMMDNARRAQQRQEEIENRFPFTNPPVPGTVNEDTHDISYTEIEGGSSIQRVDKENGHGGWI
ncbi:hypothetical protein NHQ30_004388 [Ciborinia camelliae]|nr:hypothetical protein NHQ30_004388 [Ciborinia camelliae]